MTEYLSHPRAGFGEDGPIVDEPVAARFEGAEGSFSHIDMEMPKGDGERDGVDDNSHGAPETPGYRHSQDTWKYFERLANETDTILKENAKKRQNADEQRRADAARERAEQEAAEEAEKREALLREIEIAWSKLSESERRDLARKYDFDPDAIKVSQPVREAQRRSTAKRDNGPAGTPATHERDYATAERAPYDNSEPEVRIDRGHTGTPRNEKRSGKRHEKRGPVRKMARDIAVGATALTAFGVVVFVGSRDVCESNADVINTTSAMCITGKNFAQLESTQGVADVVFSAYEASVKMGRGALKLTERGN